MKCKECGKEIEFHWIEDKNNRLKELQLCFTCDFWIEHIQRDKTVDNTFVINGWHYIVGREDKGDRYEFRGCGGSKFVIKAHDGREITTTNLWVQGEIPQHFRTRLPDNAIFIGNKFR